MSRRAVQTTITTDLLTKLLNLPEGQRVTTVLPQNDADILHSTVRLIIESPQFGEVPEGAAPVCEKLQSGVAI